MRAYGYLLSCAVSLAAAADDRGFGGAAAVAPPQCSVRDETGAWRDCAQLIEEKQLQRDALTPAPTTAAPDVERETRDGGPPPPAQRVPCALEREFVKAGIDVTLPLIALRIAVAELDEELAMLDAHGYGPPRKDPLIAARERAIVLRDDVEQMALHRLLQCMQRSGQAVKIKRYVMTAAGPVMLEFADIIAQLPLVDPPGCWRPSLVDAASVAKVARAHEVNEVLVSRRLGYYERAQRRQLELEAKQLAIFVEQEGIAPVAKRRRR